MDPKLIQATGRPGPTILSTRGGQGGRNTAMQMLLFLLLATVLQGRECFGQSASAASCLSKASVSLVGSSVSADPELRCLVYNGKVFMKLDSTNHAVDLASDTPGVTLSSASGTKSSTAVTPTPGNASAKEGQAGEGREESSSFDGDGKNEKRKGYLGYETQCDGEVITPKCDLELFLIYLGSAIFVIMMAGVMAGLTMGFISLDKMNLRILQLQGNKEDRTAAKRVLAVVGRHHLLLVTLLIWNSLANETLPIVLDRLFDPITAVIISMSCVLLFGEVIPSAIFTGPRQLYIAARMVPVIEFLLIVTMPIALPLSKGLDYLLGTHDITRYNRNELKALISIQKEVFCDIETLLEDDSEEQDSDSTKRRNTHLEASLLVEEVNIIHGALDLATKKVKDIMIPWSSCYTLDTKTTLDYKIMSEILATNHTRIPVFEGDKNNVRGLLITKQLIIVDPNEKVKTDSLTIIPALRVHPEDGLYHVLTVFEQNKSHMALVTQEPELVGRLWAGNQPLDPKQVTIEGIITLNDIITELMRKEILSESDHHRISSKISKVFMQKHDKNQPDAQLKQRRSAKEAPTERPPTTQSSSGDVAHRPSDGSRGPSDRTVSILTHSTQSALSTTTTATGIARQSIDGKKNSPLEALGIYSTSSGTDSTTNGIFFSKGGMSSAQSGMSSDTKPLLGTKTR